MTGHVPALGIDVIGRTAGGIRGARADEATSPGVFSGRAAAVCRCRGGGGHGLQRERVAIELHHAGDAHVEQRLHRSGELPVANVVDGDPMPHLEILRLLDVQIQHLGEEDQGFTGHDRKAKAVGDPGGKHSLRKGHQPGRDWPLKSEHCLVCGGVEIDVDVAHQLGQLGRGSIFLHHLGADPGDPEKLRFLRVAQMDALDAGRTLHGPVFPIDGVGLRKDPEGVGARGRRGHPERQNDDRKKGHVLRHDRKVIST